jgi:hypothetical protein
VADLFDLGDLPSWLQVPEVDTETATRVRRYVNGWLQDATGLDDWPNPVPDRLWAWAIELAGIVFENPTAKWSETIDDSITVYERGPQGRVQQHARFRRDPRRRPVRVQHRRQAAGFLP